VESSATAVTEGFGELERNRRELTGFEQDERGIFRGGGPYICWSKDPAYNVLAVLQER
jgi:hypothetical protein